MQPNRRNYDQNTIATFETFGSYFVDVFYNGHYNLACEMVISGKAQSATIAYIEIVKSYTNAVQQPERTNDVILKLHKFYQYHIGKTLTLVDFQDRLLSQFIPPDYYRLFSGRQKDNALRRIVIDTVIELGTLIRKDEMISRIIDHHHDRSNVTLLQEKALDICIRQREGYYEKFAEHMRVTSNTSQVSLEEYEKLKKSYAKEIANRKKAEQNLEYAKDLIKKLISNREELLKKIEDLKQYYADKLIELLAQHTSNSRRSRHPRQNNTKAGGRADDNSSDSSSDSSSDDDNASADDSDDSTIADDKDMDRAIITADDTVSAADDNATDRATIAATTSPPVTAADDIKIDAVTSINDVLELDPWEKEYEKQRAERIKKYSSSTSPPPTVRAELDDDPWNT